MSKTTPNRSTKLIKQASLNKPTSALPDLLESTEEKDRLDAEYAREFAASAVSPASTTISRMSWKSATSNISFKSALSGVKKGSSTLKGKQSTSKKDKRNAAKQTRPKKKSGKKGSQKKKGGRFFEMSRYIYKVLQSVSAGQGISKRSMVIMDNFLWDIFDRITSQLHHLAKAKGKGHGYKTLTVIDIQTAVKLALPGELATHAVSNGVNAVAKYFKYKGTQEA